MAKRGIGEGDVAAVLFHPDGVLPDVRPERSIRQRVPTLGEPPARMLLRVVVDEEDSLPAVVTVYATTQFRRYGAEP